MHTTNRRQNKESVRKMVIAAMLSAITAVFTFTPIGMIPLPPPLPSATMVHIPVILAALVEGPAVGMTVGLVFGLCSLIRAWQVGMVGLTLFFRNPLVSVLPRLLVPLIAFGAWMVWKKLVHQNAATDKLGAAIASAIGAIANTVLCLGLIMLLYNADLTAMLNEMIASGGTNAEYLNNAGAWLVAVVGLPNGVAEAIAAAVIVPMIKTAVDAVARRTKRR